MVQGTETQALLPFAKGRDRLQTKFLPALTKLPIALDKSHIKSNFLQL